MEDSDEFKWAVKVVIKRQMRDLMDQLRERGEEIAILTVNLDDNSCSHFGSPNGEWFVSEQRNLTNSFLNFCRFKDKRGGRSAGSAPQKGTYSSPKVAKSAALKQKSTSSDIASLRVTVPRQLAGDVTEEELAGLVGRIVASQLAVQEKGDGSSGGTKFDLLVAAANRERKKGETGSNMSTRSTRKRKVTAKYREGMTSLKRGWKSEEDDTGSEQETGPEENVVISMLAELSTSILRRVEVKTSDEIPVSLERSMLMSSAILESLAVLIIKELNEIAGRLLAKEKTIKVTVCVDVDNSDSKITVEVEGLRFCKRQKEDMDDSDMEYLDLEGHMDDDNDEENDSYPDNNDVTYEPNMVTMTKTPPKMVTGTPEAKGSLTKTKLEPLQRKKKQKKSLSETMPFACEQCGMHLAGNSNLKSHIRRVHLKQKNNKCTICGKCFWSITARESHMLSVHTRRCGTCQEYVVEFVAWSSGVDMRMKRDVICTCGAIVSIFSSFGRRRQYLRDDDPDEEANFPTPESRKKPSTATKYVCGTCGKLFMNKSNCERHVSTHTGFKGIECGICGSQFTYESSLKKHLQSEHGITNHVCDICGKNYSNKTALKVHYVKYHAQENFTIGENVVMIVKEKGNDTADLSQQMDEIMEGDADDKEGVQNGEMAEGAQQLLVSESGQVVVTRGEGGQVTLTTAECHTVGESEEAQIVQQVIHDGQVVAQEGNMSIIRVPAVSRQWRPLRQK